MARAPIDASRLDRLIDIERKTITLDEFGQPVESWSKIATKIAASAAPVSGDERFAASQFVGKRVLEFRVRPAPFNGVAPPSVLDRIIYPPAESPAEHELFDIKDVREIGRGKGWQIFAVSRAESTEFSFATAPDPDPEPDPDSPPDSPPDDSPPDEPEDGPLPFTLTAGDTGFGAIGYFDLDPVIGSILPEPVDGFPLWNFTTNAGSGIFAIALVGNCMEVVSGYVPVINGSPMSGGSWFFGDGFTQYFLEAAELPFYMNADAEYAITWVLD